MFTLKLPSFQRGNRPRISLAPVRPKFRMLQMQPKNCRAHCKQLESVSRCLPAAETVISLLGPGFARVSRYAVTLKLKAFAGLRSVSEPFWFPAYAFDSSHVNNNTSIDSSLINHTRSAVFFDICGLWSTDLLFKLRSSWSLASISCFPPGQTAAESGLSTGALAVIIIVCAAPCPTSCCFVFFDSFSSSCFTLGAGRDDCSKVLILILLPVGGIMYRNQAGKPCAR